MFTNLRKLYILGPVINYARFTLSLLVCFSLGTQANAFVGSNEVNMHLKEYSEFNVTDHDNIDDSSQEHTHKHKHSKSSKEHEHDHDHSKISQIDTTFINSPIITKLKNIVIVSLHGFYEKSFLSNPYPLEIFRPPIV